MALRTWAGQYSCWTAGEVDVAIATSGLPAACLVFVLTKVTAHFVSSVLEGYVCLAVSVNLSSIVVWPVAALA